MSNQIKPKQDTTKRWKPTKHQQPINRGARRGQRGEEREKERRGRRRPPRKSYNQKDERAKANEQVLSFIFFALQRDVKSCPGLQP